MNYGHETWKQLEEVQHFGYSRSTVFSDFVDLCLFALLSMTDNLKHSDFVERLQHNKLTGVYEDQYMQIVGRYKENKQRDHGKRPADYFAKAWEYLQKETAVAKQDVLGELYMEHISRGEHGQFFTPTQVTDLMCQIVGAKEGQVVSDPCCGSGRFFISMNKLNESLSYVGVDLSPICAKMTALNMWLFDIHADIYQGDSLSMKMDRVWKIRKGGYIYSQEVMSLPEPVRTQVKIQAQQTLFDIKEFKKRAA